MSPVPGRARAAVTSGRRAAGRTMWLPSLPRLPTRAAPAVAETMGGLGRPCARRSRRGKAIYRPI